MRGWKRHGRSKKDTRLTRLSLPYNLTNGLCSLSLKMAQRVVDSDSKIQAELCRCSGSNGKKEAWQFQTLVNSPVAKQYLTFSRKAPTVCLNLLVLIAIACAWQVRVLAVNILKK